MASTTLLAPDQASALLLPDAAQYSDAGIVSRTVLQTDGLRVVLFAFAEGQELPTHTSRRRALLQILRGTAEVLFAGSWHTLTEGSLLHLPPNHPHAVRAHAGPFTMLLTLGTEPTELSSS